MPLVLGAFVIFSLMKIPNISLETSFVTGAATASIMLTITRGCDPVVILIAAVAGALLGGALIGAITSFLVVFGKLPHLLAGILTIGIAYGLNLCLMGGSYVSLAGSQNSLALLPVGIHPELGVLILLCGVLIMFIVLLLRTQLGLSFSVQGNNPHFFKNYGISSAYVVSIGLVFGNALAGLAGYCVAQTLGFVDIHAGAGMSLFCITILIVGKALIGKFCQRSVALPMVGASVYVVLQQVLVRFGFGVKYFSVIQALIVIALVLVYYRQRSVAELAGDHLGV